jgi:hypothetical protein
MTHPISYYVSNPAIDDLCRMYGEYLEELTETAGYLMALSLLDFASGGQAGGEHSIEDAIEFQDINVQLGETQTQYLVNVAQRSSKRELLSLVKAVVEQLADGEDS